MGSTLKCFHGLSFFHVAHRRLGHRRGSCPWSLRCLRRDPCISCPGSAPVTATPGSQRPSLGLSALPSGHRMWPGFLLHSAAHYAPSFRVSCPFKFVSFFLWRTLILPTMVFKLEIWNSKRPSLPSSRHFPPVFIKIISFPLSLSLTHTVSEMNSGSEKKTTILSSPHLIVMEGQWAPSTEKTCIQAVVVKYNLTIFKGV